jgi:hypothetical protein
MGLVLPLLGAFLLAVLVVYMFARPKGPGALKMLLRRAAGMTLLGTGAILTLTGRLATGIPMIGFGLMLWKPPILEPRPKIANGGVRAGRFQGRTLDSLSPQELTALYIEVSSNTRDRTILEAYLDRKLPGWRKDFQRDTAGGPRGTARPGTMTDQQAYQILGLAPGATEAEISTAYRRLMKRVHPDQGGSTFLAAQINEAKERLLGRHR